jgi:hypothetical protein
VLSPPKSLSSGAPAEKAAVGDQDRTTTLLRKTYEGRLEIAIGSGIPDNELQAQRARRRLQVCDDGWGSWKGRVHEYAEQRSIAHWRGLAGLRNVALIMSRTF